MSTSNFITLESDQEIPVFPPEQLVILNFTASWCGPCKRISPMLQTLATRLPQIAIVKIDVDECPDIAANFEVDAMPTFIFMKNGQQINKFAGADYNKLEEMTLRILYT
jgi:thioredoxin 1